MERLTQHLPVENNPDVTCAFADCNADYMPGCDRCNLKAIANRLSAYEDTGLAPEQVARFRWIPVIGKLPHERRPVLVCYIGYTDKKLYPDGTAYMEDGIWRWCLDDGEVTVTITHWMPFPEPPAD